MKWLGRLGVIVFLLFIIFVIVVGMVFVLKTQKTVVPNQGSTLVATNTNLPSNKVVTARAENTYHNVMKSVDAKANITRVQVRGVAREWQKNRLILNTKDGEVLISFKDQIQFLKEPMTFDYPGGGTITANKGYINYLYKDGLGSPMLLEKIVKTVRVGDEVLVLALESDKNVYEGYALVQYKDGK